jgi:hypothetical protein
LNSKIKAMEVALQEEREKVRLAEDSIIDLRKKHRDDLEQLRIGKFDYILQNYFDFPKKMGLRMETEPRSMKNLQMDL